MLNPLCVLLWGAAYPDAASPKGITGHLRIVPLYKFVCYVWDPSWRVELVHNVIQYPTHTMENKASLSPPGGEPAPRSYSLSPTVPSECLPPSYWYRLSVFCWTPGLPSCWWWAQLVIQKNKSFCTVTDRMFSSYFIWATVYMLLKSSHLVILPLAFVFWGWQHISAWISFCFPAVSDENQDDSPFLRHLLRIKD